MEEKKITSPESKNDKNQNDNDINILLSNDQLDTYNEEN